MSNKQKFERKIVRTRAREPSDYLTFFYRWWRGSAKSCPTIESRESSCGDVETHKREKYRFSQAAGRECDDNLQRKRCHTVSFRSVTSFIGDAHRGADFKLYYRISMLAFLTDSIESTLMKGLTNIGGR